MQDKISELSELGVQSQKRECRSNALFRVRGAFDMSGAGKTTWVQAFIPVLYAGGMFLMAYYSSGTSSNRSLNGTCNAFAMRSSVLVLKP